MVFAPEVTVPDLPWDEPVEQVSDDLAQVVREHERAGRTKASAMQSRGRRRRGRTAVVRVSVD